MSYILQSHSNVHSPTGFYTFGLQIAKFPCPKRDSNPRRLASSYAKSSQIFLCFGISLLDQFKKNFPKKFFGLIFARNAQKNGFRGLFIKKIFAKNKWPSHRRLAKKSGPLKISGHPLPVNNERSLVIMLLFWFKDVLIVLKTRKKTS